MDSDDSNHERGFKQINSKRDCIANDEMSGNRNLTHCFSSADSESHDSDDNHFDNESLAVNNLDMETYSDLENSSSYYLEWIDQVKLHE
jgi:hypothetical protein